MELLLIKSFNRVYDTSKSLEKFNDEKQYTYVGKYTIVYVYVYIFFPHATILKITTRN